MKEKINEKVNFLINKLFHVAKNKKQQPRVALILDSYFTKSSLKLKDFTVLSYSDDWNSKVAIEQSEFTGELFLGAIDGTDVNIIVFIDHARSYEKNDILQKVFPVFVIKELGISTLILCGRAIGLNPTFKIGDLMVITDHINLTGGNPLIYVEEEIVGTRFVDVSEGYDKALINLLKSSSEELGIPIKDGIFAAVCNFSSKTNAELAWLKSTGSDAVGMSIVPQTIVAKAFNLSVIAMVIIVNTFDALFDKEKVKIENVTHGRLQLIDLLTRFIKFKCSKAN